MDRTSFKRVEPKDSQGECRCETNVACGAESVCTGCGVTKERRERCRLEVRAVRTAQRVGGRGGRVVEGLIER